MHITWHWQRNHRGPYYALRQIVAGTAYPALGLCDDYGNLIVVG